jgi:hypothetical protein
VKTWEAIKQSVAEYWRALREAPTVSAGDAVLASWESEEAQNTAQISKVRRLLSDSYLLSRGAPSSGEEIESWFREGWERSMGSVQKENFLEYGWRLSFRDQLREARAFWALRVAEFSRALSVEAAALTKDVAQTVEVISQDVAVVVDVVRVVAGAVELPPEQVAELKAQLDGVRARRVEEVARIKQSVVAIDALVKKAADGVLPADVVITSEFVDKGSSWWVIAVAVVAVVLFIRGGK